MSQHQLDRVIIIAGPTASGKTGASLFLADHFPIEIINADVGQFYTAVGIGTAKPDWRNQPVRHTLFDIIDEPVDINVCTYRSLVLAATASIASTGKIPCLVGGSLFYLKSLFFPPQKLPPLTTEAAQQPHDDTLSCWEQLKAIDPVRAAQIHPNDTYRIMRALNLWRATGRKPSDCAPNFKPPFEACIIYIDRPLETLEANINERTVQMLNEGWIKETELLCGTPWESFLKNKKLIGYPEIFSWIEGGKDPKQYATLVTTIQQKTRQYALRQNLFWRTFKQQLEKAALDSHIPIKFYQTAELNQDLLDTVCNFIDAD